MLAISGVKRETISRILKRGEASIELLSAQNVEAAAKAREGETIFITDESPEDVGRNTAGVVAKIKSKHVGLIRVSNDGFDEWEILRARIRVEFVSTAHVKKAVRQAPLEVAVDHHNHPIIG